MGEDVTHEEPAKKPFRAVEPDEAACDSTAGGLPAASCQQAVVAPGTGAPVSGALALGRVPLDVAQRLLDELNRVLEVGYGRVDVEVHNGAVYLKPQPSYRFTLLK